MLRSSMPAISSRNAGKRRPVSAPLVSTDESRRNCIPMSGDLGMRIAVGILMQMLGSIAMLFVGGIDANTQVGALG